MDYQYLANDEKENLIKQRIHSLELQHYDHEVLKHVATASFEPESLQLKMALQESEVRQEGLERAIGHLRSLLEED